MGGGGSVKRRWTEGEKDMNIERRGEREGEGERGTERKGKNESGERERER